MKRIILRIIFWFMIGFIIGFLSGCATPSLPVESPNIITIHIQDKFMIYHSSNGMWPYPMVLASDRGFDLSCNGSLVRMGELRQGVLDKYAQLHVGHSYEVKLDGNCLVEVVKEVGEVK